MTTTRAQVDYAQHKWSVQQVATSILVQAEQILCDLDHGRLPVADGEAVVAAAARLVKQLTLLKKADEEAARARKPAA